MQMGRQLLLFMIVIIVMGGCGNVIAKEVYPEMPFPDEALETKNRSEVSETFQAMKNEYGTNMSSFIRGEQLDEGETIEDIGIEKD